MNTIPTSDSVPKLPKRKREPKPKLTPLTSEPLSAASLERWACSQCRLYAGCMTPFMHPWVPVGWPTSERLLGVGEAPGEHEDQRSERPFTGRAGKLLYKLLDAAGYTSVDLALVNSVRCRPPDNRTPTLLEMRACRPFLLRVIEQLKPAAIIGLGDVARIALTNVKNGTVGAARGRAIAIPGLTLDPQPPTFVTFHPASILYGSAENARKIIDDFKRFREGLGEWPADALPSGRILGADAEWDKDGRLLTVSIANRHTSTAFDIGLNQDRSA
jgi:uracil-DNA glycosylase